MLDGHIDPTIDRGSWDVKAKKIHSLNAKTMNSLFYYFELNPIYKGVSLHFSSRNLGFIVTHEGTSQVKDSKISLLIS